MASTGHRIGTDRSWHGNTREYLDAYYTTNFGRSTWRVLASETRGGVYYAAIERIDADGNRDVYAAVQPYEFYGKGYNRELVVKDQTEHYGPYAYECSERILNLLTPTNSEYAKEWRQRAREWNEQKKAKAKEASANKIRVGDILVFNTELIFSTYGKASRFKVTEWGRKKRFVALSEDGHERFACRFRRDTLRHYEYEVQHA